MKTDMTSEEFRQSQRLDRKTPAQRHHETQHQAPDPQEVEDWLSLPERVQLARMLASAFTHVRKVYTDPHHVRNLEEVAAGLGREAEVIRAACSRIIQACKEVGG